MRDRLPAIIGQSLASRGASPASDSANGDGPDYVATTGAHAAALNMKTRAERLPAPRQISS
jgi:hypothetical protein